MQILIYTNNPSPRLSYLLDQVLSVQRGIAWTYIDQVPTGENVIIYSNSEMEFDGCRIYDGGWIDGDFDDIESQYAVLSECLSQKKSLAPNLDVFALMFHILSRAEEYGENNRDAHDRFDYTKSLLYRFGLLDFPVIDYLMDEILLPSLGMGRSRVDMSWDTMDVDNAYLYKNKSAVKNALYFIHDLITFRWDRFQDRCRVLLGKVNDPYVQSIRNFVANSQKEKIIFWLYSRHHRYDNQSNLDSPEHLELIKDVNEYCNIGLHASYDASQDLQLLVNEKKKLEKILGHEIKDNRFHFLRWTLPLSYNLLIEAGIHHDWTMGYSQVNAYRAGTIKDFFWFDLEKNTVTALLITPFNFMDIASPVYPSGILPYHPQREVRVVHNF